MTFIGYQDLGQALDQMGEPTDQQSALIRATMQGKRLEYPHRYEQQTLLNLHKAKMHLEQVLDLMNYPDLLRRGLGFCTQTSRPGFLTLPCP
jgi:hypothetical protein